MRPVIITDIGLSRQELIAEGQELDKAVVAGAWFIGLLNYDTIEPRVQLKIKDDL